jgi:hypothetical protein
MAQVRFLVLPVSARLKMVWVCLRRQPVKVHVLSANQSCSAQKNESECTKNEGEWQKEAFLQNTICINSAILRGFNQPRAASQYKQYQTGYQYSCTSFHVIEPSSCLNKVMALTFGGFGA